MTRIFIVLITIFTLAACAGKPLVPYSTDFDPIAEMPSSVGNIEDGRGRFREIYCEVQEEHGRDLPDHMPCEEALMVVGTEPAATGRPVYLGPSRGGYLVGIVPGFGWDCIEGWLDHDNSGPAHVAKFGYESAFLEVDGLSGTSNNAGQINEFLNNLPPEDDGRPVTLKPPNASSLWLLLLVPSAARRWPWRAIRARPIC